MIELLTVLVIIGILTTISLVTYGKARDRARLARVKSNVGEITLALDDFGRDNQGLYPALTIYHNTLPASGSLDTTPVPPPDPTTGVPDILVRMGNAIIGGGPPLIDNANPLQDDFYLDLDANTISHFRNRKGERPFGEPMHPVDQLVLNGHFQSYPLNPLKGPGIPMVNIAYMLYDYDTQTNDYTWVDMTVNSSGEVRTGLCAAKPSPEGVFEPVEPIWNEDNYPQGDFAYIPFEFSNEQGKYCKGYWIISYGDLTTLANSDYNKYALEPITQLPLDPTYADWPNFPAPYGDGVPDTPPVIGTVEYEVKRLMLGALDVRATVFEDQLQEFQH